MATGEEVTLAGALERLDGLDETIVAKEVALAGLKQQVGENTDEIIGLRAVQTKSVAHALSLLYHGQSSEDTRDRLEGDGLTDAVKSISLFLDEPARETAETGIALGAKLTPSSTDESIPICRIDERGRATLFHTVKGAVQKPKPVLLHADSLVHTPPILGWQLDLEDPSGEIFPGEVVDALNFFVGNEEITEEIEALLREVNEPSDLDRAKRGISALREIDQARADEWLDEIDSRIIGENPNFGGTSISGERQMVAVLEFLNELNRSKLMQLYRSRAMKYNPLKLGQEDLVRAREFVTDYLEATDASYRRKENPNNPDAILEKEFGMFIARGAIYREQARLAKPHD